MSESFFEDLNDAFPINSQVRCGQSAFRLGFAAEKVIPLQQPRRTAGFLLIFVDAAHGIAGLHSPDSRGCGFLARHFSKGRLNAHASQGRDLLAVGGRSTAQPQPR